MKQIFFLALLIISSTAIFAQADGKSKHKKHSTAAKTTYTCPLHPSYNSTKAGKCPECDSRLVVQRTGSKQSVRTAYTCPMHSDVAVSKGGKCPQCGEELVARRTGSKQTEKSGYNCPMHPEVVSDTIGKCTKCGMALERKIENKNN